MTVLLQDLRFGARMLLKYPGFTATVIVVLALGIGATTAIFSLVNGVLLKPVTGVEKPERLVSLYTSDYSSGPYGGSSYPDFLDFRDQTDVFTGLAASEDAIANLNVGDEAERLRGQAVTGNYFSVLGVTSAAGRTLLPGDEARGVAEVVISYDLWRRRFNSDAAVIGQTVTLDGRAYVLVGVAAESFKGTRLTPAGPDFWMPLAQVDSASPEERGNRGLDIVGRLKDGVSLDQAQTQISAVAARLARDYPETNLGTLARPGEPRPVTVTPETRLGPERRKLVWTISTLMLAGVGCVLLIACANVANLLLARAAARRREIAIRLSLGAGRLRLVRQLLTESFCLAVIGGVAGLLIAVWTADLLPAFFPRADAIGLDFSLDSRVLGFTLLLSFLSQALFGLAPALQATRPDVVKALKDERAAGGGVRRRLSLRNALVIVQVALSLVLLIGAGLFLRSLRNAATADRGFDIQNVLIARLELRGEDAKAHRGALFYQELQERIKALPGVRSLGLTSIVPLSGSGMRRGIEIDGYERRAGEDLELNINIVSPGYFDTMRIPIVAGRNFRAEEASERSGVVIVNEEFARRYFPSQNAIGKRVRTDSEGPWIEIVGVARNGKYRTLREDTLPFVYLPMAQNYTSGTALLVRTEREPTAVLPSLRAEIKRLNKNVAVFGIDTLEGHLGTALAVDRVIAVLLSVFGGAAMLLAAVGIYGVMSYVVAQRTHEIGVRMAVGAQARDILRLVVSQGMALVLVGSTLGLVTALALTRTVRSMLFGVSATDPTTFVGIALLLATVALLACYLPARRAAKLDPMVALARN